MIMMRKMILIATTCLRITPQSVLQTVSFAIPVRIIIFIPFARKYQTDITLAEEIPWAEV